MIERRYLNPKLEMMSRQDILNLQFRRLRELLERGYHTNPFYRRLYEKHRVSPDDIKSLEDFRHKIPPITKKDLLNDQEEFPPYGSRVGIPKEKTSLINLTSGTSGIGQEVHCLSSLDVEVSSTGFLWQCRWAGLEVADRIFFTIPVALPIAGLWLIRGAEKYGLNHFQVATYDGVAKLKLMKRFSPHCLVAVPAYINRLSVLCRENDFVPTRDFSDLRVILTAAEAYTLTWLHEMEKFWGARIFEWYGSTQAAGTHMFCCESGVYRDDSRRGMLHNLEHRVVLEVLDRNTGEPVKSGEEGEIFVTVLFREAFPSIRFKTDDRARFMDVCECDCGRPFAGVEAGTIARYDDMIKMKAMNVWPEAVDAIIFDHPEIEEYNGRVFTDERGREQVVASLEFRRDCTLSSAERIAILRNTSHKLKERVGVTMDLEEVGYGTLPRFEFKVRRWTDERRKDRVVLRYTEK